MVHTHKKRLPIPDTCPEWYATLIKDCWDQDPDARPSFAEIIKRLKRGGPAPTVYNQHKRNLSLLNIVCSNHGDPKELRV